MVSKQSGKGNDSDGADVDAGVVTYRKTVPYLSLFSQQMSKRSKNTNSRTTAIQIAQRIKKSRQNNNSDSAMNRISTRKRRVVHHDDYTDSSGSSEDNDLMSSKYRSFRSRNNSNIRHRVSMPPREGLRPRGRDAGLSGKLGLESEDEQDAYEENSGPEKGNDMKDNDVESNEGGAEGDHDDEDEEKDGEEETDGKQRPRSPRRVLQQREGGHQGDVMANLASRVQTARPSSKEGADIQPLLVDKSVSFDDVGGLTGYIDALKDMVKLNRKNMVSKQSGKENDSAVVGADADADVDAGVVTSPFLKRTSDKIKNIPKTYGLQKSKQNKAKTRTTAAQIAQRIKSRQNNNSDSPMNLRVSTRKQIAVPPVHHGESTDSSGSEDNDLMFFRNRNSRSRNDSNDRHKDKIPTREGLRPAVASTSNSQLKEKAYTQSQVDAMFAAQNSLTESIFNALRAANIAIPEFRPVVPQQFGPG